MMMRLHILYIHTYYKVGKQCKVEHYGIISKSVMIIMIGQSVSHSVNQPVSQLVCW